MIPRDRLERRSANYWLGMGLAVFIAVYFAATLCFIIFK